MRIISKNAKFDMNDPIYKDRLEYELNAICHNKRINLIDYFLVLEDTIRWCGENDVTVGPGRGSGAGSLVNYGLGITKLDPIQFKLLFERFISEGRIEAGTLPDIDLDFSHPNKVKEYWSEMYGEDRVVPIGTMQTLQAKGALKDVFHARHPEVPFDIVNKITKSFPDPTQEETQLEYFERSLKESEFATEQLHGYDSAVATLKKLLGQNRQPSIHPCGLAITEDKISDIAPMRYNNNRWSLEYNGDDCEEVGIIKYDALGLKTLKFIQGACDLVGIADPWEIPIDDKKTFESFMAGKTTAVFQFNSQVAVNILSQIPVENLDDLTMTTSVGRPGTMANKVHLDFIKLKNGRKEAIAPHPMLHEELKETYGIMIYQENVMKAAQILGGFTMAEADEVRKAMGKKKPELLIKPKRRFIGHAMSQGYCNEEEAEDVWQLMATFAGYGFNKSHAISYAFIGYICMYLKVHHTLEWWTSCFTNEDKPDRIKEYYREARESINLPDINRSEDHYLIRDGKMQMPVTGIKFVGQKACDDIVAKRPFKNFDDFYERVNKSMVNVRVVKNLIIAGAFNDIEDRKYGELVDRLYELKGTKKPKEFDGFNYQTLMEMREKVLDFISVNYYDVYFNEFVDENLYNLSTIRGLEDEVDVTIGGKLIEMKQRRTRKGDDFGALVIENDNSIVSVTVWPAQYKTIKKKLVVGQIYKIHGKTNLYEKKVQIACNKIYTLQECQNREDSK